MPRPTDGFAFKAELTPQANVEAFLVHMEGEDKEFAGLLRHNLALVLEVAERDRSEARRRFNRSIAEALHAPPEGKEGARS